MAKLSDSSPPVPMTAGPFTRCRSRRSSKVLADFNRMGACAKNGWVGVNVVESERTHAHDSRTVRVVRGRLPVHPPAQETIGIRPGDIDHAHRFAKEIYRPADVLDASFFSQVGAHHESRRPPRRQALQFQFHGCGASAESHLGPSRQRRHAAQSRCRGSRPLNPFRRHL